MATSSKNLEWYWKIFTVLLGAVVLPLAAWVWNVNLTVAQLENDLGDADDTITVLEQKVEEAEINSRAIISMEKDIEYMKDALRRIEALVTQ